MAIPKRNGLMALLTATSLVIFAQAAAAKAKTAKPQYHFSAVAAGVTAAVGEKITRVLPEACKGNFGYDPHTNTAGFSLGCAGALRSALGL